MNYRELASEQFYNLKEETLDDDRHCLGAANEQEYEIDGLKFKISVNGFWEKATWFDWVVYDEENNIITRGTED